MFQSCWHSNLQAQGMQSTSSAELAEPCVQAALAPAQCQAQLERHRATGTASTGMASTVRDSIKTRDIKRALKEGSAVPGRLSQHLMLSIQEQMNHEVSSGLPEEQQHQNSGTSELQGCCLPHKGTAVHSLHWECPECALIAHSSPSLHSIPCSSWQRCAARVLYNCSSVPVDLHTRAGIWECVLNSLNLQMQITLK